MNFQTCSKKHLNKEHLTRSLRKKNLTRIQASLPRRFQRSCVLDAWPGKHDIANVAQVKGLLTTGKKNEIMDEMNKAKFCEGVWVVHLDEGGDVLFKVGTFFCKSVEALHHEKEIIMVSKLLEQSWPRTVDVELS